MFYAEIILPIAGPCYTFSVPEQLAGSVVAGCAISVQFGVRQIVIGIVHRLSEEPPKGVAAARVKPVLSLAYPTPVVDEVQMQLWEWMAEYYMCSLGEVMRAALPTLLRRGDFVPYKRGNRKIVAALERPTLPQLSGAQKSALEDLRKAFTVRDVALLFGVPSSGKSEVGFHAIAEALEKGQDVLLLLPEISLTTQFVKRVTAVFGKRVMLYHSGLTDRRRAEVYLKLLNTDRGSLVVGTRSAIFLPFNNLGLVVVDEEQDSSYKQQDPAPRYNARDTAIVLAHLHGASVILMSATPSLETWTNAGGGENAGAGGKYGLVSLSERYGGTLPPEVIISDTMRSVKRGERKSHFNKELLDRIAGTLDHREQVILFQNRRGVAPYIECTDCGHVPRCPHCGIPLTAHRSRNADGGIDLRCHYCGLQEHLPLVCPACKGSGLATRGFGTEKIEDELAILFPSARILRLDRDSAGSEKAYNKIIGEFERSEADILIGTQMVTKGLDFAGVSLVGILNADNLVNYPDFRASERAYQLIAQVAGRAGRREQRGEVVIQTAAPENRLIAQAAAGDFRAMATEQLAERALYGYPPYTRLISIMLRHRKADVLSAAAARFRELLRPTFGDQLLGPQPPVTERIKGEFALLFLLKVPRGRPLSAVRATITEATRTLQADPTYKKLTVTPNVDPA